MSYRERLYASYVDTHFGHIRELSAPELKRQAAVYHHYFGPHLPADRQAHILEAGSGYGRFLYYLRTRGYENVEGVDISPQQVEAAKGLGIDGVVCQEVHSYLSARPHTWDCIVAIDFVDHLPKERILGVLDLFHRSLVPGGRVILQVVNGASPFAGRLRYGDFTHEFALTPISAAQLLRAAGFSSIRVYDTAPYVHGLASGVRWLAWKVVTVFLWVYLVAETGMWQGHLFTQNMIVMADKA